MLDIQKIEGALQELKNKNKEIVTQATAGQLPTLEEYNKHLYAVSDLSFLLQCISLDLIVHPTYLGEYNAVITLLEGKAEQLLDATYAVYTKLEAIELQQAQQKEAI